MVKNVTCVFICAAVEGETRGLRGEGDEREEEEGDSRGNRLWPENRNNKQALREEPRELIVIKDGQIKLARSLRDPSNLP